MKQLPTPDRGRFQASRFVAAHLADLCSDQSDGSPTIRGGQQAAADALGDFNVTGYDKNREEVYPVTQRSVSSLSPWVSHGLLTLAQLWDHVDGGPNEDVIAFRTSLLWQEYASHWYQRLNEAVPLGRHDNNNAELDYSMGCIELTVDELEEDGWIPHESRRWFASQWLSRLENSWQEGAAYFQRHLIDGSEAANQLNWRLASTSAKQFSRWQVEERAPGLCASCEKAATCPIEQWPQEPWTSSNEDTQLANRLIGYQADATSDDAPTVVWLTPQSLSDNDPALAANPSLPVVFVFDETHLRQQKFSSKKLIFWVETLAELNEKREILLWRGETSQVLANKQVAVTQSSDPTWKQKTQSIALAQTYKRPWLIEPNVGTVATFAAWRNAVGITNETLLKQFATFSQDLSYL